MNNKNKNENTEDSIEVIDEILHELLDRLNVTVVNVEKAIAQNDVETLISYIKDYLDFLNKEKDKIEGYRMVPDSRNRVLMRLAEQVLGPLNTSRRSTAISRFPLRRSIPIPTSIKIPNIKYSSVLVRNRYTI